MEQFEFKVLSDPEIRLKCLEFAEKYRTSNSLMSMVEATMLFDWVTKNKFPLHANHFINQPEGLNQLLEKAFKELIQERDQRDQPTQSSNANTDNLKKPKPHVKSFFSRFGWK